MRALKNKEYQLFERLCKSSQKDLLEVLGSFLNKHYKKVIKTEEYIAAEGDIPIGLVAHLDTVFKFQPYDIFYDRTKNVIWSPEGLGADDRAGVFLIIKLINEGFRPHIIFTTDEEIGGKGATVIAKLPCPFKDLRYLIQLDRCGKKDCVFYDCGNKDFMMHIESFGFKTAIGTFSDISILCPSWKICGVNLSVGYNYEHSCSEILYVNYLNDTYNKVKNILSQKIIPSFIWEAAIHNSFTNVCVGCNKVVSELDCLPVKTEFGKISLCLDCIDFYCNWCEKCGQLYLITDEKYQKMCEDCVNAGTV